MFTRREFIGTSLATSVAAGALPLLADAAEPAAKGDTCPGGLAQPLLHECGVEGALRAPAGALYQDRRQGVPWLQNVTTVSAAAGKPSVYSRSDVQARLQNLDGHGVESSC